MEELVQNLKNSGVLKSPQIIEAFLKVDRKDFVPENVKDFAYADEALPIGSGQTISQPYTVAFMLELLEPKGASKIMDVGYGSGWTTVLLAYIGAEVFAFERVPELCRFGEDNVSKYPDLKKKIKFFCRDASQGAETKLDGIMASAELSAVPEKWRQELKVGGCMVYPKENAIFKETKLSENKYNSEKYPGFVFVPFIHE